MNSLAGIVVVSGLFSLDFIERRLAGVDLGFETAVKDRKDIDYLITIIKPMINEFTIAIIL